MISKCFATFFCLSVVSTTVAMTQDPAFSLASAEACLEGAVGPANGSGSILKTFCYDRERVFWDARCAAVFEGWGEGTGRSPALMHCLMQTTAQQTLFLEAAL